MYGAVRTYFSATETWLVQKITENNLYTVYRLNWSGKNVNKKKERDLDNVKIESKRIKYMQQG